MGAAVAIGAGGSRASALLGFAVKTSFPGRLLIRMTGGTGYLGWCVLVWRCLYIGMAVNTREHSTMCGMAEFFRIHLEAYRFAIYIFRETGVCMAGEAVIVGRFWGRLLRRRHTNSEQQRNEQCCGVDGFLRRLSICLLQAGGCSRSGP